MQPPETLGDDTSPRMLTVHAYTRDHPLRLTHDLQCDKIKPACTACKKANMSHLCSYDDAPTFGYLQDRHGHQQGQHQQHHPTGVLPPFSYGAPGANGANGVMSQDQQSHLQQQQMAYQHQLQQQRSAQQDRQSQMAAKYGARAGQPLTGASVSPQLQTTSTYNGHYATPATGYGPLPPPSSLAPIHPQQLPSLQPMAFRHGSTASWSVPSHTSTPTAVQTGSFPQQQASFPPPPPTIPYQNYQPQGNDPSRPFQYYPQPDFIPAHVSSGNGYGSGQYAPSEQTTTYYQSEDHVSPPVITNKQPEKSFPQLIENRSDNNIDPTFYNPEEIVHTHKENVPQSKYLNLPADGLFENNAVAKKDIFQTLFYFQLLKYGDSLPEEKKAQFNKDSSTFTKLAKNSHYFLENYTRYRNTDLKNIIAEISEILPRRKYLWLMLDMFFEKIAFPFVPIINQALLEKNLNIIIGPRDIESDEKVKLTVDIDDNTQVIAVEYLLMMIRVIQTVLFTLLHPTDSEKVIRDNCSASDTYDNYISLLFVILTNCQNIDVISRLKISHLRIFYIHHSFIGPSAGVDCTPASLMALAISTSVNNLRETGGDATLIQLWYHLYYYYYSTSTLRGFPVFLTEDFFHLETSDPIKHNMASKENLHGVHAKQINLYTPVKNILNRLHVFTTVLTVPLLYKLMHEYNTALEKHQGKFSDVLKLPPDHFPKILYTLNDLTHKLCISNVYAMLLIHYDNVNTTGDSASFDKALYGFIQAHIDGWDVIFSVLMDYDKHFSSGAEFCLFSVAIQVAEKLVTELSSFVLRFAYHGKDNVSILRFYLNLIDMLESKPQLKNYFYEWRLVNRIRLFMHIVKKHITKELDLFALDFDFRGDHVVFESLPTRVTQTTEEEWLKLDKAFDQLNSRFKDSKYKDLKTYDDVWKAMDFEEPLYEFAYFA